MNITPFSRRMAAAALATALVSVPLAAQQQPTPPTQTTATTTQEHPGTSVPVAGGTVTGASTTGTDAQGNSTASSTLTYSRDKKKKTPKSERVVQSKDTRRENKKENKLNPLAGKDANLPDKVLYDKALEQTRKGHFDVARLDLQTLLNTYPDSQYQMRSKLAIADSWFKEGGSAALTQAEQEYSDFITFFPNVPEAAEAQMRVGDIYLKQMDVPDRDFSKALKAEEGYRQMLKQYPDSKLIPEARQKLREVQEVLATRQTDLGEFYATHENWPAAIARYQTVADSYPLYSHMDETLIAIGDAYASEARIARNQPTCTPNIKVQCLPEAVKARAVQTFDDKAAEYYVKVVTEHSAAPHAEDAKERLETMGRKVPSPTPEQAAASEQLEGSRAQYTLQKRLLVMFTHRPDVVLAARTGEPPLEDAVATTAPVVSKRLTSIYTGQPVAADGTTAPAPADNGAAPATAPAATGGGAPLALQDVAAPGEGSGAGDTSTMTGTTPSTGTGRGNSVGVEVLTPGVNTGAPRTIDKADPTDLPAAKGAPDPNYGLKAVGPTDTSAPPPVEKPEAAPDPVNEAQGKVTPAAGQAPAGKKKAKTGPVDKEDESSSKKKPKKGLDKLNPF